MTIKVEVEIDDTKEEKTSKDRESEKLRNKEQYHHLRRPISLDHNYSMYMYCSVRSAFDHNYCGKHRKIRGKHQKILRVLHGCTVCGEAFTSLSAFDYHKKIHVTEKPYM